MNGHHRGMFRGPMMSSHTRENWGREQRPDAPDPYACPLPPGSYPPRDIAGTDSRCGRERPKEAMQAVGEARGRLGTRSAAPNRRLATLSTTGSAIVAIDLAKYKGVACLLVEGNHIEGLINGEIY